MKKAPFKFLSPEQYAALTMDEKVDYLNDAVEHLKTLQVESHRNQRTPRAPEAQDSNQQTTPTPEADPDQPEQKPAKR